MSTNETERVRRIWEKLAPNYDKGIALFEKVLFSGGRQWACSQARGVVLEIGVGTGRNLEHYPEGIQLFYKVTNGVAGQLGITAVAPGSPNYHGGSWAVNLVSFKTGVTPYLLTSAQAVLDAEATGDVTIVRRADLDFRCPVQP